MQFLKNWVRLTLLKNIYFKINIHSMRDQAESLKNKPVAGKIRQVNPITIGW